MILLSSCCLCITRSKSVTTRCGRHRKPHKNLVQNPPISRPQSQAEQCPCQLHKRGIVQFSPLSRDRCLNSRVGVWRLCSSGAKLPQRANRSTGLSGSHWSASSRLPTGLLGDPCPRRIFRSLNNFLWYLQVRSLAFSRADPFGRRSDWKGAVGALTIQVVSPLLSKTRCAVYSSPCVSFRLSFCRRHRAIPTLFSLPTVQTRHRSNGRAAPSGSRFRPR